MRNHRRERGVALLLVLIALAVLGAMTVDLMEEDSVYVASAANSRDALKAEYLARSGVNLSRLMLSVQPMLGSALNFPFWQYTDVILEPFSASRGGGGDGEEGDGDEEGGDDEGGGSLLEDMVGLNLAGAEGLGLEPGEEFKVTIVDEESKIQVNTGAMNGRTRDMALQHVLALTSPVQYDALFDRAAGGDQFFGRQEIACEMLDFADPDEDLCDASGGEDATFYDNEDAPYLRKNAPFDSLEELHLVKGIGDDYWSAFVDPDPEDPAKRIMTVWGKGRINVNTASTGALWAAVCSLSADETGVGPCSDPTVAANLAFILQCAMTMRSMMINFGSASEFLEALENPQEKLFCPVPGIPISARRSMVRRALTTRSSVFSIYSEGRVGNARKRIHAVIDIEGLDTLDPTKAVTASGGKILYWRME